MRFDGRSSSRFGVLVPVAATDEDWKRLPDLLDSLWTYDAAIDEVVVLDDGPEGRPLPRAPTTCKITRVPNLRSGRGDGWSGGLCAGMIGGYQYLHQTAPSSRRFVLRIDTDALVIAPFANRVAQVFEQRSEIGMMGSYLTSPNGKPRGYEYWGQLLQDMLHPWLRRTTATHRPATTDKPLGPPGPTPPHHSKGDGQGLRARSERARRRLCDFKYRIEQTCGSGLS